MTEPTPADMPEPMMTPEDLAAFLGVPKATLYRWRHHGDGPPAYKFGRHIRWRRSEVDQWLEQQSSKTAGVPMTEPTPADAGWEAQRLLGEMDDIEMRAALGYLIGVEPQLSLRAIRHAKGPDDTKRDES